MAIQAKISGRTKALCEEIKAVTGDNQIDILEKAAKSYHRIVRLQGLNQSFSELRENEAAWDRYQGEQELLDGTLGDSIG